MNYQEHHNQVLCINWLRSTYPWLGNLVYAVPNGQHRTAAQSAILKSEGMTRGVSDICIDLPSSSFHALRIEMKTAKGSQEPEQEEFQLRCEAVGIKYAIVRSYDDFEATVNDYMRSVPQSTISALKDIDEQVTRQRIEREVAKNKRASKKAQQQLKSATRSGHLSSATEDARKELRAFLSKFN